MKNYWTSTKIGFEGGIMPKTRGFGSLVVVVDKLMERIELPTAAAVVDFYMHFLDSP